MYTQSHFEIVAQILKDPSPVLDFSKFSAPAQDFVAKWYVNLIFLFDILYNFQSISLSCDSLLKDPRCEMDHVGIAGMFCLCLLICAVDSIVLLVFYTLWSIFRITLF